MVKASNSSIPIVILDTDVIVNWLTREKESRSGKELWKAPYEIILACEEGKLKAATCITNLFEIRFLLRRKKGYSEGKIKEDLDKITGLIEVVIPDEIELLRANNLQLNNPLDPFDAILLATGISLKPINFVSRDSEFLKISSRFLISSTPEVFIQNL
jgi:predicted nucleic acid-binding protein